MFAAEQAAQSLLSLLPCYLFSCSHPRGLRAPHLCISPFTHPPQPVFWPCPTDGQIPEEGHGPSPEWCDRGVGLPWDYRGPDLTCQHQLPLPWRTAGGVWHCMWCLLIHLQSQNSKYFRNSRGQWGSRTLPTKPSLAGKTIYLWQLGANWIWVYSCGV